MDGLNENTPFLQGQELLSHETEGQTHRVQKQKVQGGVWSAQLHGCGRS